MPIYEYRCQGCGDVFERLWLTGDGDDNVDCPSCGEKRSEKLLSAFCSLSSVSGEGLGNSSAAGASHSCASHGGFS